MAMSAAGQKPTDSEWLRLVHNGSLNGGFAAGSIAGRPAVSGANWKHSNSTTSAFTETVWPACRVRVTCAVPRRSCRSSGLAARGAKGAKETSARSHSRKDEALRHAFPLLGQSGKLSAFAYPWERDGSLNGELLWAPTTVSASTLERAEELVKRDLGDGTWDEWLEKQGKTGRRCRSRGGRGNSHRGSNRCFRCVFVRRLLATPTFSRDFKIVGTGLSQHAQTKKPMNIRCADY